MCSTLIHRAKIHTKTSQPFHHLPTQELTSFPVWVWQHHLTTVTPTSHLSSLSSRRTFHTLPVVCSASLTAMASPLTPMPLPQKHYTWQGSHCHLSKSKHRSSMPRPSGSNKTHIHIHTATAHTPWEHTLKRNCLFFQAADHTKQKKTKKLLHYAKSSGKRLSSIQA